MSRKTGLLKGEKTLAAILSQDEGSKLKDDLKDIAVVAHAVSYSGGVVTVDYSFTNVDACKAEIAATEDGGKPNG